MAKPKKKTPAVKKSSNYAQILVLRSRRNRIIASFIVMILAFMSLLITHLVSNISWLSVTLPVMIVGLLGLLVPQSEQWEYKPWQDRPERHERISFESREEY